MEKYELICNKCLFVFTCVEERSRNRYNQGTNLPVFNEYDRTIERRFQEGMRCPYCREGVIIPQQIEDH